MRDEMDEQDVDLEFSPNLKQGRMNYIAAMAQELAVLARKDGEVGLSTLLDCAQREATIAVGRIELFSGATLVT